MWNAYIVTGVLTNEHTVTLEEALPLSSTKVRLVVEPLAAVSARPYHELMAAVRERQAAHDLADARRLFARMGVTGWDDYARSIEA